MDNSEEIYSTDKLGLDLATSHKKAKKRKRSSNSGSSEESVKSKIKKHKKKCKKRHKKNKAHKKSKSGKDNETSILKSNQKPDEIKETESYGPRIPDELLLKSQTMGPMSKEQWEEKSSKVHRVFDHETGRNRLIKGDGEVIEEIVSRKRHLEINKQATLNSGSYFQSKLKDMN
uniref:ADP-ribosylation factor-like protein 6-interacting protein 4 n=1 Tax=Clastoptera arizonana TaxID=38151 RepID=A0A1B6CG84_9HEMI